MSDDEGSSDRSSSMGPYLYGESSGSSERSSEAKARSRSEEAGATTRILTKEIERGVRIRNVITSQQSRRADEKQEMGELNSRLDQLVDAVKRKKSQNDQLQERISQFRNELLYSSGEGHRSRLDEDLRGAKLELNTVSEVNTMAKIRASRSMYELDRMRERYDEEVRWQSRDHEKIRALESQRAESLHELSYLKENCESRQKSLLDDSERNDKLREQLRGLTDALDREQEGRVDLECQIQTLLEKKKFEQELHRVMRDELERLFVNQGANRIVDPMGFYTNELREIKQKIREDFNKLNEFNSDSMKHEYEIRYSKIVEEIETKKRQAEEARQRAEQEEKTNLESLSAEIDVNKEEIKNLKLQEFNLNKLLQELQDKLADAKNRHEDTCQQKQTEIDQLYEQINNLKADLSSMLSFSKSLDSEVAVYARLLNQRMNSFVAQTYTFENYENLVLMDEINESNRVLEQNELRRKQKELEENNRRLKELEEQRRRQKELDELQRLKREREEEERRRKQREREEEERRKLEYEELLRKQREEEEKRRREREREEEERLRRQREEEEERLRREAEEQERLRRQREEEERLRRQRQEEEERLRREAEEQERLRRQREEERLRRQRQEEEERLRWEAEEQERLRRQREEEEERLRRLREEEEKRRREYELEQARLLEEEKRRRELEEQLRLQREYEERLRLQKIEEEQIRIQREYEEKLRREEEARARQREEQIRIQREFDEQLRKQRELEERRKQEEERLRLQRDEQLRLQIEYEEKMRRQREADEKMQREIEEERRRQRQIEARRQRDKEIDDKLRRQIGEQKFQNYVVISTDFDQERLDREVRLKKEREEHEKYILEKLRQEQELIEAQKRHKYLNSGVNCGDNMSTYTKRIFEQNHHSREVFEEHRYNTDSNGNYEKQINIQLNPVPSQRSQSHTNLNNNAVHKNIVITNVNRSQSPPKSRPANELVKTETGNKYAIKHKANRYVSGAIGILETALNGEYIILENLSSNKSVNLKGWYIHRFVPDQNINVTFKFVNDTVLNAGEKLKVLSSRQRSSSMHETLNRPPRPVKTIEKVITAHNVDNWGTYSKFSVTKLINQEGVDKAVLTQSLLKLPSANNLNQMEEIPLPNGSELSRNFRAASKSTTNLNELSGGQMVRARSASRPCCPETTTTTTTKTTTTSTTQQTTTTTTKNCCPDQLLVTAKPPIVHVTRQF